MYIVGALFPDFVHFYKLYQSITYVDRLELVPPTEKILSLSAHQVAEFSNLSNSVFKMDSIAPFDTLNNKSLFAQFMITNGLADSIPETYYYHTECSTIPKKTKFIRKPDISFGGNQISILKHLPRTIQHNCIISRYIPHKEYYVGHYLVIGGKIAMKTYFCTKKAKKIQKGPIGDYTEVTLNHDEIFDHIFSLLKYEGFACSDFTIINGKIKIFEINPRIGGSLIRNRDVMQRFLDFLINDHHYLHDYYQRNDGGDQANVSEIDSGPEAHQAAH